jgi:phytol kinase
MREYLRKGIHLIFGLAIAALMLTVERGILLALFAIAILAGFLISDAVAKGYRIFFISPVLDLVDRNEKMPGKGALFFVLSALVSLILFPEQIAFLSILALALVDGVATIAGRTWGRTRIARGKSLEGSFTGAFLAFVAFLFFIPMVHAALLAIFVAAVELFSPVDDNLVIPIAAGIFLQLLGLMR